MDSRNKTKTGFIFFAAMFLTAVNCLAQDSPVVSTGDLQFYIDHASFSGKENKTYTEFYLMLFSDQLMTNNNDTATVKELLIKSSITDSAGGQIVSDRQWYTNALLPRDSIDPVSMVVYDQWAELIDPGIYNIRINISSSDPVKSGNAALSITIPEYPHDSLTISQVEFVSEVQNKIDNTPFIKAGKKIIPDPWRRYGALNSRLTFFYEIYNRPSNGSLQGEYIIRANSGKIIKKLTGIKFKDNAENISIVHAIDVSKLATGVYNLGIILNDSVNNQTVSQYQSFEIIQMDSIPANSGLTQEDAEIEGILIKYIGTPKEYNFYQDLDLKGKAQYIVNFWSEKDPTPGTPENEFLQKVKGRFHYASQNFKWGVTPGWKTDRARVLIKYGMPEDIEQHSTEAGTKNYDIWTYNKDKTFIFVFADLRLNGNYILIHSTKEGEISDPNWKDYLQ